MNANSIAIDVRMLQSSGIGTYIRALMPRIIEQAPDLSFHLLGDPLQLGNYRWSASVNVSVVEFTAPIYSVREQVEVMRKVAAEAGLIWSPHYNLPVLSGKRLLVTVHDVFHLAMPDQGIHKRMYARLMFAAVAAKAERVICVSDFTATELSRLTGMARGRMDVIHNGVENDWFDVDRRPDVRRPFMLYVGNVKPHKNLARLVEAFSRVLDKVPHDLVIVGRKEGFITGDAEVAGLAARLGERVRFTGYVDDGALRDYFAAADGLVFPSLYEGFGLPPLEAMACGCPVLTSCAASLPEVCADAALYCDPYSVEDIAAKLVQLSTDSCLRATLKGRGVERARMFSWDLAAEKTLAVLRDVLQH